MKYEYCVYIGRFSPFHNAHLAILNKAFSIAENVIVIIGSANSPRTIKNPWNDQERKEMIQSTLTPDQLLKTTFINARDNLYNNNAWLSTVQEKINQATNYSEKVALIGFESDDTSWYLKSFPQLKFEQFKTEYDFHATDIRNLYFSHDDSYKSMVPQGVSNYLELFKKTKFFNNLKEEKNYIDNYKESWRGAPFPPIFVTTDCVVIRSGHILVVTRRCNPGKGLYALPGGFLNQRETIVDGAIRELKEETGIKVSIQNLKNAITNQKVFDSVDRSLRGRTITHAFLIDLLNGDLPAIKGGDDAERAFWLPFNEFYELENQFFDDHYFIINYFIQNPSLLG